MGVKSFGDLFVEELKDAYDAEKQMVKALPKMIDAVGSQELRSALQIHLDETQGQVLRLEQVFNQLGMSPTRKTCEAMHGLLEEADSLIDESDDKLLSDAATIAAAQKVEHYEIATYGTLRAWAQQLGYSEIAGILQQTLDEETDADQTLNQIAYSLNMDAVSQSRNR
jgi:ferritin-like metal-binding protein YciE